MSEEQQGIAETMERLLGVIPESEGDFRKVVECARETATEAPEDEQALWAVIRATARTCLPPTPVEQWHLEVIKITGDAVHPGGRGVTTDNGREYKCDLCGGTFESIRPEDEAIAEMDDHFPGETKEDCAVVCDVCYQRVRPDANPLAYSMWRADRELFGKLSYRSSLPKGTL